MAERKTFVLRMDPALWSELEAWAQAELRSVNGQIEYLLRDAVRRRKASDPDLTPGGETPGSGLSRPRPDNCAPS
jgi:hypothetical protein